VSVYIKYFKLKYKKYKTYHKFVISIISIYTRILRQRASVKQRKRHVKIIVMNMGILALYL